WSELSVPSMPLSMVPFTVQFHVPAVPAETVPAASPPIVPPTVPVASSSIAPPNISAASSSAANVSSPHVNALFDLHVDIPTSASLNSETIVAAQKSCYYTCFGSYFCPSHDD
ncbi:hypothetical protein U1Q18_033462, partial [Sarracenia purpurea var. burkii]